jgi:hypothetical protein
MHGCGVRHPPSQRDAQLHLRSAGEPGAHRHRFLRPQPHIRYLHTSRLGRAALVYDLMEPPRSQVDRLVLSFVRSHSFSPNDFLVGKNGVCRLHPQLARQVAQLALSDVMVQEIVTWVRDQLRVIIS